jgi:hypothetical protein
MGQMFRNTVHIIGDLRLGGFATYAMLQAIYNRC